MKFDSKADLGVAALHMLVAEAGWAFRNQPQSDFGIDAQIELVLKNYPNGKLLGVQVKTGDSYLRETKEGLAFYTDSEHVDYWLQYDLPVVVVFFSPTEKILRWVHITHSNLTATKENFKIIVPESNILSKSTLSSLQKVFNKENVSGFGLSINKTNSAIISTVHEIEKDLQLPNWYDWCEYACSTHIPSLPIAFVEGARHARVKFPAIIFPRDCHKHIEASMRHMIDMANEAVDVLKIKATYIEPQSMLRGIHQYKSYLNPNYYQDNIEHVAWERSFVKSFETFVKSANLFCDIVREHLDEEFRLSRGRLLFSDDFCSWSVAPQYTLEERLEILCRELRYGF